MPRSFLVKKNKLSLPYKHSKTERRPQWVMESDEELVISQTTTNSINSHSAFVSFANTSFKERPVSRESFSNVDKQNNGNLSPTSLFIPSSSPLVRNEPFQRKNTGGKIPQLEPISVIYSENKDGNSKDREKENCKNSKNEAIICVPSVKGPLSQSNFLCQLCKKLFQDAFSLAQHKCSGIKIIEHRCPECNKVFSCPANLASHRRWHRPRSPTSNKPIKLEKQRSSEEDDLISKKSKSCVKEELVICEEEYEGSESGEEIPSPVDKNNNAMQNIIGTGNTKYICEQCGKCFKRQAYLRKHMNYHNNARPYPCQYCGKIFRSQTNRAKHVLNHAVGPKAYNCLICGNGFASRCELEKHVRIHNGEVFRCKECSGVFYSFPGLQRHILKAHKTVVSL